MDAVMQFLAQVAMIAALVVFFAMMAAVAGAIVWFGYHLVHDHWTLAQAWRQARVRLFHEGT